VSDDHDADDDGDGVPDDEDEDRDTDGDGTPDIGNLTRNVFHGFKENKNSNFLGFVKSGTRRVHLPASRDGP